MAWCLVKHRGNFTFTFSGDMLYSGFTSTPKTGQCVCMCACVHVILNCKALPLLHSLQAEPITNLGDVTEDQKALKFH
jgi:hypothetical protein